MAASTKNQIYAQLMEDYKKELLQNPTLSMTEFCIQKNLSSRNVQNWMRRKDIRVAAIRRAVFPKKYEISETPGTPAAINHTLWNDYIEDMKKNGYIPLTNFCRDRSANIHSLSKWMKRQNLTTSDARIAAGISIDADKCMDHPFFKMSESTSRRMSRLLAEYKKLILLHGNYSMVTFCQEKNVEYKFMVRWLETLGLTVKQIKAAVVMTDKFPRKRNKVFVQFTPNGGNRADSLKGVKIQLADGANILVQECTVLSLCSFINQYNIDQKKKR